MDGGATLRAVHRRPRLPPIALSAVLALVLTACGDGDSADGPRTGREIYERSCATCHGPDGEGGRGLPLGDGAVEASLSLEDQIAVIRDGRGGAMPAWEGDLSEDEIEAVAVYEREELGR
jgi:mono/diheme cytochrome c family protein